MRKLLYILPLLLLAACQTGRDVPGIIFDTDLGNDSDDVIAAEILHRAAVKGEAEILAEILCKGNPDGVEMLEILQTRYGLSIPIGKFNDWDHRWQWINYAGAVCRHKPPFPRKGLKEKDIPLSPELYRKTLAEAADGSVTICAVGFSNILAPLLDSAPDAYSPLDGRSLIEKKVKRLVMMAGDFKNPGHREYNVRCFPLQTAKVFSEWPTDIVLSPWETGDAVQLPYSAIDSLGDTPLAVAYKAYKPEPYDEPCFDPTAALIALGRDDLFTLSPRGNVEVAEDGQTFFTEDPAGRIRYASVDSLQASRLLELITNLISDEIQ